MSQLTVPLRFISSSRSQARSMKLSRECMGSCTLYVHTVRSEAREGSKLTLSPPLQASPFHFEADDPHEVIKPAVDGTLGILRSALKNGNGLQRVVMCVSLLARSVLDVELTSGSRVEQNVVCRCEPGAYRSTKDVHGGGLEQLLGERGREEGQRGGWGSQG